MIVFIQSIFLRVIPIVFIPFSIAYVYRDVWGVGVHYIEGSILGGIEAIGLRIVADVQVVSASDCCLLSIFIEFTFHNVVVVL